MSYIDILVFSAPPSRRSYCYSISLYLSFWGHNFFLTSSIQLSYWALKVCEREGLTLHASPPISLLCHRIISYIAIMIHTINLINPPNELVLILNSWFFIIFTQPTIYMHLFDKCIIIYLTRHWLRPPRSSSSWSSIIKKHHDHLFIPHQISYQNLSTSFIHIN